MGVPTLSQKKDYCKIKFGKALETKPLNQAKAGDGKSVIPI